MKTLLGLFQIVLIALCVVGFVRIALRRGAFRHSLDVWRELPRRPSSRFIALVWLAVFVVDLLQTKSDAQITAALGFDLTPFVFASEGTSVAILQSAVSWAPLTVLLSFAYMILFPALLFGSAHAYDRLGDTGSARMVGLVYAINYLVCLPFYIFAPVTEPWAHAGSHVLPLSDLHVHPWLIDLVRPMSGLDNCFPSYHTSLTVSLVLLAFDAGPRRFARVAAACGILIVFSTMYLGFHWLEDVAAGGIAGWLSYAVARRFQASFQPGRVAIAETVRPSEAPPSG